MENSLGKNIAAAICFLIFTMSPVEAQIHVVAPDGDVGIGTDSPDTKLHVLGELTVDGIDNRDIIFDNGTIYFNRETNVSRIIQNGGNGGIYIATSGTAGNWADAVRIYPNGDVDVEGTLTWGSDERKKTDLAPIENALEKIQKLRGISFKRTKPENSTRSIGLSAQNVETVFPEAVRTGPDGFKSVAYHTIVAPLIEAVKEQQGLILTQQRLNEELTERVSQLERQQLASAESDCNPRLSMRK